MKVALSDEEVVRKLNAQRCDREARPASDSVRMDESAFPPALHLLMFHEIDDKLRVAVHDAFLNISADF